MGCNRPLTPVLLTCILESVNEMSFLHISTVMTATKVLIAIKKLYQRFGQLLTRHVPLLQHRYCTLKLIILIVSMVFQNLNLSCASLFPCARVYSLIPSPPMPSMPSLKTAGGSYRAVWRSASYILSKYKGFQSFGLPLALILNFRAMYFAYDKLSLLNFCSHAWEFFSVLCTFSSKAAASKIFLFKFLWRQRLQYPTSCMHFSSTITFSAE